MAKSTVYVLRDLLRAALREELPVGWFYLPETSRFALDTPVMLVTETDNVERDADGLPRAASDGGFVQEGLDTPTLVSIARGTTDFASSPSDDLLLEAFVYYHRFDAFLPQPGAPDPPPWSKTERRMDREFYDSLGPERANVPCREAGCTRGAISYSVLCRPHHFENVKRKSSPFRD